MQIVTPNARHFSSISHHRLYKQLAVLVPSRQPNSERSVLCQKTLGKGRWNQTTANRVKAFCAVTTPYPRRTRIGKSRFHLADTSCLSKLSYTKKKGGSHEKHPCYYIISFIFFFVKLLQFAKKSNICRQMPQMW